MRKWSTKKIRGKKHNRRKYLNISTIPFSVLAFLVNILFFEIQSNDLAAVLDSITTSLTPSTTNTESPCKNKVQFVFWFLCVAWHQRQKQLLAQHWQHLGIPYSCLLLIIWKTAGRLKDKFGSLSQIPQKAAWIQGQIRRAWILEIQINYTQLICQFRNNRGNSSHFLKI